MTHMALQRVIVRMMYDPPFVERVYDQPSLALSGTEIGAREQDWIVDVDPRAWGVDRYRRSRSLTSLIEEYPASCALLARCLDGLAALDGFFSSPRFHEGMQQGRSLALDFGDHLVDLADAGTEDVPCNPAVTRLESAIARARRANAIEPGDAIETAEAAETVEAVETAETGNHAGAIDQRPTDGRLDIRWASNMELAELPEGTLEAYRHIVDRLASHPSGLLHGVLDTEWIQGFELDDPGESTQYLLLREHPGGDMRIETLSDELYAVLEAARHGAPRDRLESICVARGADTDQARALIDDFLQSGELRRARTA